MVLRTENGYPEIIVATGSNIAIFYATANWLEEKLGVAFDKKVMQNEIVSWGFSYEGSIIVLNYEPEKGTILYPFHQQKVSVADRIAFDSFVKALKSNN